MGVIAEFLIDSPYLSETKDISPHIVGGVHVLASTSKFAHLPLSTSGPLKCTLEVS